MRVVQAFRFELDPNRATRVALAKHVGAARFAYNWGLAHCLEALERGERIPSAMDLHKAWNEWKRRNAPWWVEVSKCTPQEAFRDLERALGQWQPRTVARWKARRATSRRVARPRRGLSELPVNST
jgi:putative transposase